MAVTDAGAIGGSIAGGLTNSLFGNGLANAISGSSSVSGGSSDSVSDGGSQNSAYSIQQSNQGSESQSQNSGWANVAGLEASANSAIEAQRAHERQLELLQEAQDFNRTEAEKQRNWQANMANTVYTRSVKNMIEAGINPILAANLGLSAGNVGSGASASVSTPSSFMGQTFAEQNSASQGSSFGNSWGNSSAQSSSKGSSWNHSQSGSSEWSNSRSGLAEGLMQMAEISEAAFDNIQSSEALKFAMRNFGDARNWTDNVMEKAKDALEDAAESFENSFTKAGSQNWMTGIFK